MMATIPYTKTVMPIPIAVITSERVMSVQKLVQQLFHAFKAQINPACRQKRRNELR